MPAISNRGKNITLSPIRKLAPLANAARKRGVEVLHLNIGQPDIPTPEVALEAIRHIDRKILEYSPSEGIESLRRAMADYYKRFNINLLADEIIVTCGGSEAVNFAFLACLNEGDEIIVPEPAYANYISFATAAGVRVVPIISSINQHFALPPIEQFEQLISPRTKGILLCNPNNPTGYLYTRTELEKIRDLVKRHDLYLFSDEVYREFCYTDQPHVSVFHLEGIDENIVMIDSVSKRYSECGIRIGALVSKNRQVLEAVMKLCQARLSPPLLGQIVAEASFRNTPASYLQNVYNEYLTRRNCLIAGLNSIEGVFSPTPAGAFYTVARLPIDDAERFCAWLLSDFQHKGKTVMLSPASGFYTDTQNGKNEVRIAYVLEKQKLEEAIEVLREALNVYRQH